MINWEEVLRTADELGIEYEKVESGQGGFYLKDGVKLTVEEILDIPLEFEE